jgi:threonine dehydratase
MVDYNSILQARENISDYVKQTPIARIAGGFYLKLENTHDEVNAFKIRGAYNKIKSLYCSEVVTAAVGSHGFAVGHICKSLGIQSVCFMPETAPEDKKEKMEGLVDKVIYAGQQFSETEKEASEYATCKSLPFIHPYNDELVIAGQGTIGLEIIDQMQSFSNVYVPVGGGGLISGIGIALAHLNPDIRIVGVQPQVMHAMASSITSGEIIKVDSRDSIAEPLCVNLNPNAITFDLVQKYVDEFIFPSEDEVKDAMGCIHKEADYIVEGAGAIALAAALKDRNRTGKSVCIVSGGNIDHERFFKETRRK